MSDVTQEELVARATEALVAKGYGSVVDRKPLSSGMQSTPYRWRFSDGGRVVVKTHAGAAADWFVLEAEGLEVLARNGLRVPRVVAVGEGYLVLEDLGPAAKGGGGSVGAWERFGGALARAHRVTHCTHGWAHDNYLGILPQTNVPNHADGVEFFIQHRVVRYFREWGCEKHLTAEDRRAIERVGDYLRASAPKEPPGLLHGDLHSGNVLARAEVDEIATFDPAVYYGLREVELSLAEQFGGFPDPFWAAYEAEYPLAEGWRERLPLYRLKEHLGLLAQFGPLEWFYPDLMSILGRFK